MSAVEDWTIITVTHNSRGDLAGHRPGRRFAQARWVVVDNASGDGSADLARDLGADVLALNRNVGFAKANNAGLALADSRWVVFANPDVEVEESDLPTLAETCGRTGGLVAPQLLNRDGTIQRNGRGLPFLVDKFAHRGIRLPGARADEYLPETWHAPTYVVWAIGAAVAAARSTFEALGGWDERYFLYYEDHDLGLRAWRGGYPVVVDPGVRWVHGWRRATMVPSFGPWRRELASGLRFFAAYPEFVMPSRRVARRRHPEATASSGAGVGGNE